MSREPLYPQFPSPRFLMQGAGPVPFVIPSKARNLLLGCAWDNRFPRRVGHARGRLWARVGILSEVDQHS